jgi:hypothetical protein
MSPRYEEGQATPGLLSTSGRNSKRRSAEEKGDFDSAVRKLLSKQGQGEESGNSAAVEAMAFSYAPLSSSGDLVLRRIVQVRSVGPRRMYDIEVSHPKHNFLLTGGIVTSNSETYLHFYPGDKRRIYRAHKAIGQLKDGGHIDYDAVARVVNLDEEKTLVSTGELINLLSAASVVSANALPLIQEEDDPPVNPIDRYADLNETRPDILLEEEQARNAVSGSIARLTEFERKLFKLKGIDL